MLDFNDDAFDRVSNEVKKLIKQCSELSLKKRISAREAANSAWIKNRKSLSKPGAQDPETSAGLIAKFKKFSSTSRFIKEISLATR